MIEIVVFAEARGDQFIACGLADRVLLAHSPESWTERDRLPSSNLDQRRKWVGLQEGDRYVDLHHYKDSTKDNPRRYTRRPNGESPGYDYALVRVAISLTVKASTQRPQISGLLIVRDMDSQSKERQQSAVTALGDEDTDGLAVLFAYPEPCMEAWLLSGFLPEDRREEGVLNAARCELNFDPTTHSQRLRALGEGENRNAKRVLRLLTDACEGRAIKCWEATSLQILWRRGVHNGIQSFFQQVTEKLVPMIEELDASSKVFGS